MANRDYVDLDELDEDTDDVANSGVQSRVSKVGDKRKSLVWHHYHGVRNSITNKLEQAICKYCENSFSCKGTSAMNKHLLTCKKFPQNVDKKQKLISVFKSSNSGAATVSNWEFDHDDVRLALARMIVIDEQPFSFVEREGFRYFHMRCTAHILNLIVRDGLSLMKDPLRSIRGAVRYVRSSPARSKTFDECAKTDKISYRGSVCLDVSTRWNSTYLMLESAIKFEKAFDRYFEDMRDVENELKDGVPKKDDWENARVLTTCLRQFYESTKRMSGSLYVTANSHFHEVLAILSALIEWENDDDVALRDMGNEMRLKFDKYYGEAGKTNIMVLIAVVLDPRYKLKFVRFALRKLYHYDFEKGQRMYDLVCQVLRRLFAFYSSAKKADAHGHATSTKDMDVTGNGLPKTRQMNKLYAEFDEEEADVVEDKCELDVYLEDPREKIGEPFDILSWWSEKCRTYKVMGSMAKDILAIPVSTVSSESAFSTSGRVLDQFRSSLGPKTVEVLVCTQDWLRASYVCIDIEQYLADVEIYEKEVTEDVVEHVNKGKEAIDDH